ncbi:MAG: hypothetical protein U9P80_07290 [Thermodesulfobacteriota bacterium]|nr:hypothetical protein [Thermodesulfobacteriota bacterium]
MDNVFKKHWVAWTIMGGFVFLWGLWILSFFGLVPFTYKDIKTPHEFMVFLDSPKDNMQGVKVNGHWIAIGKRPSLQILPGYDEHLYAMKPYRKFKLKPRNMTRPEIVAFCMNITGMGFTKLRSDVSTGNVDVPRVWDGRIDSKEISLIQVGVFSYLVTGILDRPIFIAQAELAKRLGMPMNRILNDLIVSQSRWLDAYMQNNDMNSILPVPYLPVQKAVQKAVQKDRLVIWLDQAYASQG